jgi:hypothetical protein
MTVVTDAEREAMARMMAIMNGEAPPTPRANGNQMVTESLSTEGGPGSPSQAEIHAMARVLENLNKVANEVIMESNPDTKLAVHTRRDSNSVSVGEYKIEIHLNEQRAAGKQYYSIEHSNTGIVIANDITLYEVALAAVKMLNNHKYVNNPTVRRLFELDDHYTSCKIDAVSCRQAQKRAEKRGDMIKEDIYATKFQKALDTAGGIKRDIKAILEDASKNNR